jgi:hypothetical protein
MEKLLVSLWLGKLTQKTVGAVETLFWNARKIRYESTCWMLFLEVKHRHVALQFDLLCEWDKYTAWETLPGADAVLTFL